MNEFETKPDNFKLRLPKSLYFELEKKAEVEGVSFNQYCLYLLAKNFEYERLQTLGKLRLNELLRGIRNRTANNIPKMLDEIQVLADKVESLKVSLFYDIKQVLGKRGIPDREVDNLEERFPVIDGKAFGEKIPRLKMPTAKIVLSFSDELRFCEIRDQFKEIIDSTPRALYTEVHVDDISDRGLALPDDVNARDIALRSKVIYFLSDDFMQVRADIQTILEQLKTLFGNRKVDIKIDPTYLSTSIEREFKKYLAQA